MHPDLFSFGPLTVHSYGLMAAIGILSASWYFNSQAHRIGLSKDQMIDLFLVIVLSGFLLARIFYVVYEWDYFKEHLLEIPAIWKGGIIYYGGLIGGLIGFLVFAKIKKLPYLRTLDILVTGVTLAHVFGRIGCFLNGCCYGKETLCPLGVQFPFAPAPLHPTQLYEAVFCLALFLFLAKFYQKNWDQHPGKTAFLYFAIYPIGRFLIEFLRSDMVLLALGFTLGQWTSLAIFTITILISLSLRGGRRTTK